MANHWAEQLADRFEDGTYLWQQGSLKGSLAPNSFCLVGGMLDQAGVVWDGTERLKGVGVSGSSNYLSLANSAGIADRLEELGCYIKRSQNYHPDHTVSPSTVYRFNDDSTKERVIKVLRGLAKEATGG